MLGPILAAIIIILLIVYAAYPMLANKDFHGWANIALTALILFTVIVVLFVILGHRKGERIYFRSIPAMHREVAQNEEPAKLATQEKEAKEQTKEEENKPQAIEVSNEETPEISDEEALMAITKEYLEAEEAFKAKGDADYQQKAAQQIIDRYDFTQEDWQAFLEDAARDDLFNKAKAEMNK